jgi:hypothetical protein
MVEALKSRHPDNVSSVFVLDALEEPIWDAAGAVVRSAGDYHATCSMLAAEQGDMFDELVPRCVVWRCGTSPVAYRDALLESTKLGNTVCVFTEASRWFPAAGRKSWPVRDFGRNDVTLDSLFLLGRTHVRNMRGERCAWHWIADTQYPYDLHRVLRDSSTYVATSKIEGEMTLKWIRGNFGVDARRLTADVQALPKFKWLTLRGEAPQLAEISPRWL